MTDELSLQSDGYSELKVDFWFYARGFESNEDFLLEFYDGNQWRQIGRWEVDDDFDQNEFNFASVTISNDDFDFTDSAKIRIRCDASNNSDDVYIDEVLISAR